MASPLKPVDDIQDIWRLRQELSQLRIRYKELKSTYKKEVARKTPHKSTLTLAELNKRVRLLQKKPDMLHVFYGYPIFKAWYLSRGLKYLSVKCLIVLSHYKYFIQADIKYWQFWEIAGKQGFNLLIDKGWAQKVIIPGQRRRMCYVLTPKGKELVKDYEGYYNEYFKLNGINTLSDRWYTQIKKHVKT